MKDAFSTKLYETNKEWDEEKKKAYEKRYPVRMIKDAINDISEIIEKIKGHMKKDV